ncbi:MAG: FAD-dependent oxidoreductase, partial [Defluviitaleaceae bacterium]|nr:FAD-dependent oxidoreductase [Defluviitaleaceae bacterium]
SGITHAICNCCGCGCLSLRSGAMYKNVDMLRSNYVAEPKKDDCTACGQCVEHCPMNAVQLGQKLTSKGPVVDDITTTRTPRNNEWTRVDWNADYRTNRKVNVATGTAPCKSKCPAHIGVQGYIKLAANGKYKEALELIKTENPFPAVCGYVCNRRCEDACTRQSVDEAVAIDEIKKYIAIQDLDSSTRFIPTKRNDYSDKKIAIIGAGPAGLTCAYFLALDGYDITVFEREEKLGGMLTLGIPEFVLGKDIVDAEIEVLKELGVKFKTGVNIGKDITLDDLRKEGFLAFYLAIGAQGGRSLGLEGENAEGVASGVSFLRDVNLGNAPQISGKVVVIGGGNVAIDVARVAARIDGTKVGMYCIESKKDMPAMDEEIETAEGEGITITNGVKPKKILVTDGKVTGVEFVDVNDESKVTKVECAHVYLAIGQTIEWGGILNNTPVKLEDDERIIVDELTYQSAQPDIFAGGDAVTGTKYAIDAIAAGKQGAISIHRFVQPGHDLRIGRSVRDFSELDTTAAIISNYDNTPRQRAEGVMTAEQVQAEAKRCLDCGVSVVDEYMCVGCGMCITKCKFEAIKLKREYDGEGVEFLKIRKTITPHVIKRRIKVKVRKLLGRK